MNEIGIIGIGKMGISHLSILGANPRVKVVGVADNSKMTIDILERHSPFQCFTDHNEMIMMAKPKAVFVSTPTRHHYQMVKQLLEAKIHVFVEKPFCMNSKEGKELVEIANQHKVFNQVGYHNKFIGTFSEAKKIIRNGWIGEIVHFNVEMYGPVVIKKKEATWRAKPDEGGGCLMDYAAHSIDLVNDMIGNIKIIDGAMMTSIHSRKVEDAVYALVKTDKNISGVLNINWSDETYRKMSTTITILGTHGKIIVDTTELKLFLKDSVPEKIYTKGWNIRHINELAEEVGFYLRGEEYSAQIEHFIDVLEGKRENNVNHFQSALQTDLVIEQIKNHKKAYDA